MKYSNQKYSVHEAIVALRRDKLIQIGERSGAVHLKLTQLDQEQNQLFNLVGLPYGSPIIKIGV